MPAELDAALRKANLRDAFEQFSFSHRRKYVQAVLDAKRPETRAKRIAETLDATRTKAQLSNRSRRV